MVVDALELLARKRRRLVVVTVDVDAAVPLARKGCTPAVAVVVDVDATVAVVRRRKRDVVVTVVVDADVLLARRWSRAVALTVDVDAAMPVAWTTPLGAPKNPS